MICSFSERIRIKPAKGINIIKNIELLRSKVWSEINSTLFWSKLIKFEIIFSTSKVFWIKLFISKSSWLDNKLRSKFIKLSSATICSKYDKVNGIDICKTLR